MCGAEANFLASDLTNATFGFSFSFLPQNPMNTVLILQAQTSSSPCFLTWKQATEEHGADGGSGNSVEQLVILEG